VSPNESEAGGLGGERGAGLRAGRCGCRRGRSGRQFAKPAFGFGSLLLACTLDGGRDPWCQWFRSEFGIAGVFRPRSSKKERNFSRRAFSAAAPAEQPWTLTESSGEIPPRRPRLLATKRAVLVLAPTGGGPPCSARSSCTRPVMISTWNAGGSRAAIGRSPSSNATRTLAPDERAMWLRAAGLPTEDDDRKPGSLGLVEGGARDRGLGDGRRPEPKTPRLEYAEPRHLLVAPVPRGQRP